MIGLGATTGQLTYSSIGTAAGLYGSTAGIVGAIAPQAFAAGAAGGPIGLAIAGIVAGVAEILSIAGVGSGCGQACIQASNIVNQVEPILKQNLAAYQAGQLDQPTALANFNQLWQQVISACSAIPGSAGKNCVGDRQEGACHYKDANSACWNWFIGYRDPLLVAVPSATTGSAASVTSAVSSLLGGENSDLLLAGGLAIAGLLMVIS